MLEVSISTKFCIGIDEIVAMATWPKIVSKFSQQKLYNEIFLITLKRSESNNQPEKF